MYKKAIILMMSLLVIGSQQLSAGTVSFDQLAVSDDLSAVKYNGDLNRIYQKVNSNIQTDNVANDTLTEADMADEINPRIRTVEGAACQFVYTGIVPATGASLTTNISAGTAYPMGFRIVKSSATPKTYNASKWTWVDLDQNGDFQYPETAIGGATPAVSANSIRIAKVSSDTTTVNTVTDLRTTSCTSGPFNIIADATGEGDLGDILTYGNGGWNNGLNIVSVDATTLTIQPGAARINGEFRALTTALTVNSATTASPTGGISGIDAGALAAATTYYVYGVADLDGVTPLTGIMSTSSSAPSGATNYRRLGEISTHASSASMASADPVSVSYSGKIRQIKRKEFKSLMTSANTIPNDDSVPQVTEGFEFMSITFTPSNAANFIEVSGILNLSNSSGNEIETIAFFKDSYVGAFGSVQMQLDTNVNPVATPFSFWIKAGSTSVQTYRIRACGNAGTTGVNGTGAGARLLGGTQTSFIKATEYEA